MPKALDYLTFGYTVAKHMKPICIIETPFPEKFGVPRQPLLIMEAKGKMVFPKDDFYSEAFRGIEENSHLWLIFAFHLSESNPNALVRPPRFEGKKKLGVFATRSPHRPNGLGLSVVKFESIEYGPKNISLWVSGVDLVNGTPILDIKPYVPYVDARLEATSLFNGAPEMKKVIWECDCLIGFEEKNLIEKAIGLDPRPGHQKDSSDEYGISLCGMNLIFVEAADSFIIKKSSPLSK